MKKLIHFCCLFFIFCFISCSSDEDLPKIVKISSPSFPIVSQFYPDYLLPVNCDNFEDFTLKLLEEVQKNTPSLKDDPIPYRSGSDFFISERTVNLIFYDESFKDNEIKPIIANALKDEFLSVLDSCN
jgi:hypothetical protein